MTELVPVDSPMGFSSDSGISTQVLGYRCKVEWMMGSEYV